MMASPSSDPSAEGMTHRVWGKPEPMCGSSDHSSSGIDGHEGHADLQQQLSHVTFVAESIPSDRESSDVSSLGKSSGQDSRKNKPGQETAERVLVGQEFAGALESSTALTAAESHRLAMEWRAQLSRLHLHTEPTVPTLSPDAVYEADEQGESNLANTEEAEFGEGEGTYEDGGPDGNPYGEIMSVGSQLHASGACKPCLYLNSRVGCCIGRYCRFCHLSHPKKKRPRPCKAKRTQCKQIVNMLCTVFGPDSKQFEEASQKLSSESQYMRSILGGAKKNMRDHAMHQRVDTRMLDEMGSVDLLADYSLPTQQHPSASGSSAIRFQ